MTTITEADVEEAALAWLFDLGWVVAQPCDQTLWQVAIRRTITLQLAEA